MQEEGGVQHCCEADRDAMEAREDFRSMSGEFLYRHHVMPRENVLQESSFSIPLKHIDVVRQTKTNLDNLEECINDLRIIDGSARETSQFLKHVPSCSPSGVRRVIIRRDAF